MTNQKPLKVFQSGKAITTTRLNIRSGPDTNADKIAIVAEKIPLAYDGYTLDGENISGNSKWFFTHEGSWFWSGGVNTTVSSEMKPLISILPQSWNWNQEILNIPLTWRQSRGKKIKVAVLDTGITIDHPDFFNRLSPDKIIDCSGDSNADDVDNDAHGTHCSGIIGANSKETLGITGVAPECDLIIIKIVHPEAGATERRIIRGIETARKQEVDIINLSIGDFIQAKTSLVQQAINSALADGIIVVAAAGDNQTLCEPFYYPAMFSGVIAVGSVDKEFFQNMRGKTFYNRLDILLPKQDVWSCSSVQNNYYKPLSGSSMSCAFVSGILALWLSLTNYEKTPKRNDEAIQVLNSIASPKEKLLESKSIIVLKP